jgi:hypothetical protein
MGFTRLFGMGLLVGLLAAGGIVWAQGGAAKAKAKPKPGAGGTSVKALDVRTTEFEENLLKEATEIAKGYEDAGQYEQAKRLLEVLLKLNPKLPGLKEKIDALTDKSLDSSEFEYELDVSRGWSQAVGMVVKERLVRIETTGIYKFDVSTTITPDGLPTDESGNDLVGGLPIGALIGVIVNPDNRKPGKPFELKGKKEFTAPASGFLQLRVNVPNGHKCTGKLKVKLSGVAKLPT